MLSFLSLVSALITASPFADEIAADYAELSNLYRELHAHPELSLQERETAARMAAELEELGFDVTTGVGGHGVVGVLRNGSGPTVMIRADMDALPIDEQTGLPYASEVEVRSGSGAPTPVMHACGHDVHMTVFVGTARQLVARRDNWSGTLMMIAQPAEEVGAGARAMLEDGLFDRFPRPDYNLALHVASDLPAGSVGAVSGYFMANVDSVDIVVKGQGGHGAYPERSRDPVVLAGQIILALQTIVSREVSPFDPAVVTVGSIHGGSKHNIIPNEVRLQLTLRSYTDQVREQTIAAIRRITHNLAEAAGMPAELMPEVIVRDEHTPAAYNDPALTERILGQFRATLGEQRVIELSPEMIGEDFGRYGRDDPPIPSLMFRLGTVPADDYQAYRSGEKTLPGLHSASFAPDPRPTITGGIEAMTTAALELLKQ